MVGFGGAWVRIVLLNFPQRALPLRKLRTNQLIRGLVTDNGPRVIYQQKIDDGLLYSDVYQNRVIESLQRVYNELQPYTPTDPPSKILQFFHLKENKVKAPKGLYIHGSVGGGKTMLMDLFFNTVEIRRKKRVHFNAFMLDIHARIHLLRKHITMEERKNKPFDPIPPVAEEILNECYLLCFDEFQVTDIGDAMILKRLFTQLFDIGCIVVATSNRPPEDLYLHGLQRSNFVPFIQILKDHCEVISLNSGIDYRKIVNSNQADGKYFVTSSDEMSDGNPVDKLFKFLISKENDIVRPRTINIMGRNVKFNKACGQVLDSTFSELCDRPVGSSDYIMLARTFHTIIIRDVPQIVAKTPAGRRFITLIDNLYDNKTRVVISSSVPLYDLFSGEITHVEDSNDRVLMDDLGIEIKSENSKASIFTGEEELFAFDRCISRLTEMQTNEYWNRWEN